MREKVPPKYHMAVYAGLIAIPVILILIIGFLLFGRGGSNEPEVVVQITAAPTEQLFPTNVPEIDLPTSAPIVVPTDIPAPPPTDEPIVQPTIEPIVQPTTVPVAN